MKTHPTKPRLTEKQRLFVVNKQAGCTNRDAAVAAGYAVGSASAAADKLMAMPAIRAALKTPTDTKLTTPKMPREKYPNAMAFLIDAMNLASLPIAMRVDAAKALLPYQHAKLGEIGKKEKANEKARGIARGKHKFATKQPPALTLVRND